MSISSSDRSQREKQVDALIALYYQASEQGQPLNQAEFLQQHPEFSAELREFFANVGRIEQVAQPINPVESGTVASVGLKIRDYRILEEIGAGGMGTVYLALHTRLEKTVALKILKADRKRNPQSIARFEREMKAVGKLEHPHIVRALDAGDEAGVHFLVMEYIAGCDLGRLLQVKGRLEVPLACELIRQAALGLQHAHDHNLVHRDVKPSNLILSRSGQVKILDLGLAQLEVNADHSGELTWEGQLVGTWLYMAPEQFLPGRQVDSRSDIFSLGVTFYSFLVGELPLNRGQAATQLPAIGTQRPDLPPDVQTLLTKMLAPNQDQRIQAMAEVAWVLQAYATQGSVNIFANIAGRVSAANGVSPALVDTQAGPSTANEPEVVPPPVQATPSAELPAIKAQRSPRRPRQHFAIAGAGVVTLLVLLAGVATNWENGWNPRFEPEPPPVPPTPVTNYATIDVTIADPDDKEDYKEKALVYAFIKEIVEAEKLYLIDPVTKVRTKLGMGKNGKLPVGSCELISDSAELQLPPSSILELTTGSTYPLRLRLSPPNIYARLPKGAGAFCSYTGTLQHRGLPTPKAGQKGVVYDLTLRTLGVPLAGLQWLQVEVTTHGDEGKYSETAWLLVDSKRYQEENKLYVNRGWIVAESEPLSKWLKYLFPEKGLERLEADFSPKTGGDSLKTLAKRLSIQLPLDRITVNEALVLFFDAQIHAPKDIGDARALLANPNGRVSSRKRVDIPGRGTFRGWTLSPGSPVYKIEGADEVPFLFANVSITAPPLLTASCVLTGAGVSDVAVAPPFGFLPKNAEILASLRNPPEPFDVARIPEELDAQATFKGMIQLKTGPLLNFTTSVRTAGFPPDSQNCWLEIDVKSGRLGTETQEKAWILVPKKWRKEDGFRIQKGWLSVEEEMLPFFDKEGKEVLADEELFKLGKSWNPLRVRVHQVLSLLFDAHLEQAGDLTQLRTVVDAEIKDAESKKAGSIRVHSLEEIQDHMGDKITCDAWRVPREAKLGFWYYIRRSRLLPFDFYSVDLESPDLIIHTKREWSTAGPATLPFEESVTEKLAGDTQKRIDDPVATADKDNLRIWRDGNGKIVFWGEYAAQSRDNKKVWLKFSNGMPATEFQENDLSATDLDWIKEGRYWRNKAGDPLWPDKDGKPNNRAKNTGFSSKGDEVYLPSKEDKSIPIERLWEQDQIWVEEFKILRYGRVK